jgi:FkbM family methyltransferase
MIEIGLKCDSVIRPRKVDKPVEPYIIKHGFSDLDFYITTEQAADWYDPPKDYVLLEYGWVAANIAIKGKNVVDAGSHHGHYSVVLASQYPHRLSLIDTHDPNMDAAEINLSLNHFKPWQMSTAALWNEKTTLRYDGHPNGALMVNQEGGIEVDSLRLKDVDLKAEVVKLDIEGSEYVVIPEALETMNVESWIIEFHSGHNIKEAPDITANLLKENGYELDWVNRDQMVVEPYKIGTEWTAHSTIFARR